jgi:hypothetical protein
MAMPSDDSFVGMTPFMNLKMLLFIYLKTASSGLVLNELHGSSPSALAKVSTICLFRKSLPSSLH